MSGVENTTYVGGLNQANPEAQDFISQGDDHLKLIKKCLLNTFPGFSRPIDGALFPWSQTPGAISVYAKFIEQTGRVGALEAFISPLHVDGAILRANNNLSDVADPAVARANLGIPAAADVLLKSQNLNDVVDKATARTNLGVPATADVLTKTQNLLDVQDTAIARQNLDVFSKAETFQKNLNFSDVVNAAVARSNLGAAAQADVLLKAQNFSDVPDKAVARFNLDVPSNGDLAAAIAGALVGLSAVTSVNGLLGDVLLDAADVGAEIAGTAATLDAALAAAFTALFGAANGLATLDGTGKVPLSQLPPVGFANLTEIIDATWAGFSPNVGPNRIAFGVAQGISANFPDGTPAGGNARALNSVDLQTARSAADKVASGDASVLGGGQNNKASGPYSVVKGGLTNTSAAQYSTVGGGANNTTNGEGSTVGGGWTNLANADYATIAGGSGGVAVGVASFIGSGSGADANSAYAICVGGQGCGVGYSSDYSAVVGGYFSNIYAYYSFIGAGANNTVTGNYSVLCGGLNNYVSAANGAILGGDYNFVDAINAQAHGSHAHTRGRVNSIVEASGAITTDGDIQKVRMIVKGQTTDATPKLLTSDGNSSGYVGGTLSLPTYTLAHISGKVIGRTPGSLTDYAVWTFDAMLYKDAGAGATLVSAVTPTLAASGGTGNTWVLAVTAGASYGDLLVTITGEAGKTVTWGATLDALEVRDIS